MIYILCIFVTLPIIFVIILKAEWYIFYLLMLMFSTCSKAKSKSWSLNIQ